MNRRNFNALLLTTPFLTYSDTTAAQNVSLTPLDTRVMAKFDAWLAVMRAGTNTLLITYMSNAGGTSPTLSTIASVKVLLLFLALNRDDDASQIGSELAQWVEISHKTGNRHTRGGLPSELIERNGQWQLGDFYYASDNLCVSHALFELYRRTQDERYGIAAIRIGKWLEQTLFDGRAYGVWRVNYGMPMHYLRQDGAVNNAIHAAGDFMWLKALVGLHHLMPSSGWLERLALAKAFMQQAQMPSGAWYTYFQPDRNKASGTWHGFRGDDITIGDDNLRSALAAQHFGMTGAVERFKQWLTPYDNTLLWGYLHTDSSQPKFLPQDKPYFDVVCTGLLRSWYRKQGDITLANKCQNQLNALQSTNGGWCWAVNESDLRPLNQQQAVITGCWAVADIDTV